MTQKRLVDLIECFLSPGPGMSRNRLRVFAMGQDQSMITYNPFTTNPEILPAGSRLVFSFRDNLNYDEASGIYANAFLAADRSFLLTRWNLRLRQPTRLPAIYEPTSPISISNCMGSKISHLALCYGSKNTFLLASDGKKMNVLDIDRWGEKDAILPEPLERSFNEVTYVGKGISSEQFFLVGDRKPYKSDIYGWKLNPMRVLRESVASKNSLKQVQSWKENSTLFLMDDGKLILSSPTGNRPLHFRYENELLHPCHFNWLEDGNLLFSTPNCLWYGQLNTSHVRRVFGPVTVGPLHFCVDKKNILYVTESSERRLSILLPSDHWICPVCGTHKPFGPKNGNCPECRSHTREKSSYADPFRCWIEMDLNSIGNHPGPIVVDNDLNLYLITNSLQVVALPLSRKDLWGEGED